MRIEFGPRSEDPYGRALFYVYTEAGESVAEKLIREGPGLLFGDGIPVFALSAPSIPKTSLQK